MRVLVIEDDEELAEAIGVGLRRKLGTPPLIETVPQAGYRIGS